MLVLLLFLVKLLKLVFLVLLPLTPPIGAIGVINAIFNKTSSNAIYCDTTIHSQMPGGPVQQALVRLLTLA